MPDWLWQFVSPAFGGIAAYVAIMQNMATQAAKLAAVEKSVDVAHGRIDATNIRVDSIFQKEHGK